MSSTLNFKLRQLAHKSSTPPTNSTVNREGQPLRNTLSNHFFYYPTPSNWSCNRGFGNFRHTELFTLRFLSFLYKQGARFFQYWLEEPSRLCLSLIALLVLPTFLFQAAKLAFLLGLGLNPWAFFGSFRRVLRRFIYFSLHFLLFAIQRFGLANRNNATLPVNRIAKTSPLLFLLTLSLCLCSAILFFVLPEFIIVSFVYSGTNLELSPPVEVKPEVGPQPLESQPQPQPPASEPPKSNQFSQWGNGKLDRLPASWKQPATVSAAYFDSDTAATATPAPALVVTLPEGGIEETLQLKALRRTKLQENSEALAKNISNTSLEIANTKKSLDDHSSGLVPLSREEHQELLIRNKSFQDKSARLETSKLKNNYLIQKEEAASETWENKVLSRQESLDWTSKQTRKEIQVTHAKMESGKRSQPEYLAAYREKKALVKELPYISAFSGENRQLRDKMHISPRDPTQPDLYSDVRSPQPFDLTGKSRLQKIAENWEEPFINYKKEITNLYENPNLEVEIQKAAVPATEQPPLNSKVAQEPVRKS